MKLLMIGSVFLGVGIVGGMMISRNWHAEPPAPVQVAESSPSPAKEQTQVEKIVAPKPEPLPVVSEKTNETKTVPVAVAPADAMKSAKAEALRRAIETLVSPQTTFQDKQAALKQLREGGQLDEAMDALKKGAAENPGSAEYPTAMGEVGLQKAYALSRSGGSVNQMGMVGMQADQNFDDALKLDPSNWEAQYFKAAGMSYWPAELNKGPEVTQRLLNLIDQQETMPSQPQFAQTYALLGDQYQKAGQTDYASQTWQLGAARFPADTTLRAKIAGLQNR